MSMRRTLLATSRATASSMTCPSASTKNNRGGTWDKGKGCDTFGPTGPWLVTRDELNDPQDVDLWLEVTAFAGRMVTHGR